MKKEIIIGIITGLLGFILFDVLLAFGIINYFDKHPINKTDVYEEDYIVLYKSELDEKFDKWRVTYTKIVNDGPLGSDIGGRYVEYTVWEITYWDSNGDTKIFELNNRSSFEKQVNKINNTTNNELE